MRDVFIGVFGALAGLLIAFLGNLIQLPIVLRQQGRQLQQIIVCR